MSVSETESSNNIEKEKEMQRVLIRNCMVNALESIQSQLKHGTRTHYSNVLLEGHHIDGGSRTPGNGPTT
jgi:hypothetical protein